MEITGDMIEACYLYAKKVYHNQIDKTTATNQLYSQMGMHQGSARDYIGAFCSMMNGERYTRTINTSATKYYLQNIGEDYGSSQLEIALRAVSLHTEYYGKLGNGRLKSIEKLVEGYKYTS